MLTFDVVATCSAACRPLVRLTEDDVQMVNDLTQHIERTRSAHSPKIGDRVIHVAEYGISVADRTFCENQQRELYMTLEQLERWYEIFTVDAERFRENHKIPINPLAQFTRVLLASYPF